MPPSLVSLVAALCPELAPAECFAIVSEPGSRDQPEHTDAVPDERVMSAEQWQRTRTYVGALAPLTPTDELCGRTAVLPGAACGSPTP